MRADRYGQQSRGPIGTIRGVVAAGLRWLMAYQRPFRVEVARYGLVVVAPASIAYILATLVVSALWLDPVVGHRAVTACCAWRAATVTHGYGALIPLFGSAFPPRPPSPSPPARCRSASRSPSASRSTSAPPPTWRPQSTWSRS